jgi:Ca-activated chloride channel family protein
MTIGLFGLLFFAIYLFWWEHRYFAWVREHWFYNRSGSSRFASLLLIVSFLFFVISLADFRGEELNREERVEQQTTLLLIDASASMSADDLTGGRFKKAVFLARHFVAKSNGHKVAIAVFANTAKMIIPFTTDIDLLDTRLAALEKMDLLIGGSDINGALDEAVGFLRSHLGNESGNILLFTDGEENVPRGRGAPLAPAVALGVIGVGTSGGAFIPNRNTGGHKQWKGEKIVSVLDKKFLNGLSSRVKHFKLWTVPPSMLPTEEVVSFFDRIQRTDPRRHDMRMRPPLYRYLVVPGIILMILSGFLRMRPGFIIPLFFLIFAGSSNALGARGDSEDLMMKFKNGHLKIDGKLKAAEYFLRDGLIEEALIVFSENKDEIKDWPPEAVLNLGAALIENKNYNEALGILERVSKNKKFMGDPVKAANLRQNVKVLLLRRMLEISGQGQNQEEQDGRGQMGSDQDLKPGKVGRPDRKEIPAILRKINDDDKDNQRTLINRVQNLIRNGEGKDW